MDEQEQAKKITAELRKAISDTQMVHVMERIIRPTVIRFVNERTMRGEFLGGDYANRGYSEATIPAFFAGTLKKSGNEWALRNDELNTTIQPGADLIWRVIGGSRMAFLLGGYKNFRRLAGRNTGTVDLTFTGRMMQGLDVQIQTTSEGVTGRLGVFNERARISGYVNRKREFLGLTDSEQTKILNAVDEYVYKSLP